MGAGRAGAGTDTDTGEGKGEGEDADEHAPGTAGTRHERLATARWRAGGVECKWRAQGGARGAEGGL